MNILLEDFNAKWGERAFTNQQSRMRVYMEVVMIMRLG
jgi:hypothetical protein